MMLNSQRASRSGGRFVILALALAMAGALPAQQPATRTIDPAMRRYLDLVRPEYSGDRAREIVAFMDQYWRVPGNTGFNASINRVVDVLRRAGFVEQSRARSDDRLVYRVERRRMEHPTWDPDDASLTIVGQDAPLLTYKTNRNMLAINSYPTTSNGVEAELIYVGKGAPADFTGEMANPDVAGRIVLGDASVSHLFTEAVQKRGALGVLSYAMPEYTRPEVNRHSIQFSSIPLDTARRRWGLRLSYDAHEALLAALERGPVKVLVQTRARIYDAEELTLVAEVRGSKLPNERYVFSAHVQEPGANDNASGVGAQAEMARTLATLVRNRSVSPERTITFLWGNEISSTQRYLQEDSVRTRGVLWGTSLDMVGEDTQKTGGTFLIEKMPDPSAIWTRGADKHTEWGGRPLTVKDMTPHYFNDFVLNRCLDQAAGTGWVVRTNPFEGGSDHTPFIKANKPGVLFWHFTDQFYHTDGDRLDKVSAQTMRNVGISALTSALVLTSADGRMARALVGETERAAMARLDAELALSSAALAAGGDRAKEALILQTWTDWYRDALRSARDIQVGGSDPETIRAIDGAVERTVKGGAERVARLGGGAP